MKEIFQKVRIQKFVSLPTSSFLDMLLKVNQSSTALTISITLCSNIESSFSGEHLTFCEPKSIGNSKSFDDFFHNEETRLGSADETNKTIHYQDNHPSTFHVDENSKSTVLSSTTSSTSISQAGARAENSTLHSLHSVSLVANFLSLSGFAGLCDVIIHHGISGKDEAISALFVPMGPIKALLLIDVTSLSKKHSLFKKVNSMERNNAQSSVDEKENQFAKLLKEFCCALSEDELKRNIEIYKSNGSKAKFRSIHRNQMNSSVSVDSCNSSTADGRSQVLSEIAIKNTLKSQIPLRENNESKSSSMHRENSIKIISKTSIKPQSRGVRMQQKVKSGGESFSRTKMSNQLLLSKKETRFPFSELPPPELSLMEESNSVLGMQCNSHSLLTAPATEIDAYLPTACPPPSTSLSLSKPSDFTPETIPLREKLFTTEESTTTDKSGYTSCSPVELSTSSLILGLDVPLIGGELLCHSIFPPNRSNIKFPFIYLVETTISPAEESVTFRKNPKSKATSLNSESVVLRRSPRMLLKETDHLGNTVDFISNSVPVPAVPEISDSKNTTPEAASASADRYCLRGVSTSSSGARTPSFETFSFAQTPSSIAINYYTSASGFTPNVNIKSSKAESVYLEMIVSPDNAVPALQEDSCCSLIGVEIVNFSVCAHDSSSSSSPLHNVVASNSNDGISLFQSVVGGGTTKSAAQSKLRPNCNEEKRQKIEEPIPDSACLHTLPQMEVVNTAEIVADGQPGQADDRQEDAKINEKLSQAHEGFSNLEEIPQSIKNLLHRCLLCRQISPMDCAKELLHIIAQCTADDMPSSSTTTSGGKRKMKTVDNSKQKNSKISTSCYRSVCQVRLWNALVTILREVVWKKIGSDAEKIELFCGCCIILIVLEIENGDRIMLSMALNAPTADGGKGKMRGDQQNIQTLKKSMDLYINRLSTALSSNFLYENDQQRLSLGWLIIESGTEMSKDGEKGRPPFRSVSMRSITDLLHDNYSNSSMWSHVTGILEEFIEEDGPTVSPETLEKENLTTMVTDIDTQSISVTHAAAPVQDVDNFCFTNSVPVADSSPPEPLPAATAGGLSGAIGATKSSLSSKGKIVVDRKSSLIGHRISMGQKKRVTIDPSYAVNLERRNTERIQSQLKRALTFSGLSPSPSTASDPNAIDMIPSTQFSIINDSGGVTFKRSGQRQRAQIIQETPCEHQGRSQEKRSLKRHRSESDAISRRSRFEINPAWAAPPSPSPSMMFLSGELACQPYDDSASPVVTAKEGRMDFDLLASSTSSAQDRAETFLGIGDGSFLRSSTAASETMVTSAEGMRRPARRKTALDTSGVLLFQEES